MRTSNGGSALRWCRPPSEEAYPGAGWGREPPPTWPEGPLPPGAACCRPTQRSCGRPGFKLCKPASPPPTGRARTAATVRCGPLWHPHGRERMAVYGREAAPAGCSHTSLPVQCERVFVSHGRRHAHSGTQAMLQLSPPVPAPWAREGEGPTGQWRLGLLRAEQPLTPSPEAGPHGISIHEQHRLCYGLSGAQRQGRERAAACAERGRQQPVWRLWPAGPPLGQHQPGCAALH